MKKFFYLFWGLFTLAGAVMLITEIVLACRYSGKKQHMELCDAVISEIRERDNHTQVYVDYGFDGKRYSHNNLGYFSSSMEEGDNLMIYVNPDKPKDIMAEREPFLVLLILGILGGAFFLTGGIGLAVMLLKKRGNAKLTTEGERLQGVIEAIEQRKDISVNGAHPYYALVSAKNEYSGLVKYYKSELFGADTADRLCVGGTVSVYVKVPDESRYFVDVEGAYTNKQFDWASDF